ncbi:MAG: 50S ribosomal protein L3, partial [Candidatus Heimdallarchaeota archaeon]|nr:50S ribosomal protein L3 [Candidatus Heimdallarchaeota archaeon]
PRYGQMGYFRRTEYNKRVMQLGVDGEEITPDGGFVKYGIVKNRYIVVKGSIPGPKKRMVMLRNGVRVQDKRILEPKISYTSTRSQQG